MRKSDLLKIASKFKKSKTLCILQLQRFLESEKIVGLKKNENVRFIDYLNFVQANYPNYMELFKEPLLEKNSLDAAVLNAFLMEEAKPNQLVSESVFNFKLTTIHSIPEPTSALTISPTTGNLLSGCCYPPYSDQGEIVFRDADGKRGNAIPIPASALAYLPDGSGNFLVGTCFVAFFHGYGSITLHDARGDYIKTLVDKPACAIAFTPDGSGNFLVGTSFLEKYGKDFGEIKLYSGDGKYLKTLVNESATALAYMPDGSGNILSGTCYTGIFGGPFGKIVIRNPEFKAIQTIDHPATSINFMKDGNLLISTFFFSERDGVSGEIAIKQPTVTQKKIPVEMGDTYIEKGVNEFVLHQATIACIKFQKGVANPTEDISPLCRLPKDLIKQIYEYVFPISALEKKVLVNAKCFPSPAEKDFKRVPMAQEFADKVWNFKFFEHTEHSNKTEGSNEHNAGDKKTKKVVEAPRDLDKASRHGKCRVM